MKPNSQVVVFSMFPLIQSIIGIFENTHIIFGNENVTEYENLMKCDNILLRLRNTRLVSSKVSLSSWEEGATLALVDHLSGDVVTIKIL